MEQVVVAAAAAVQEQEQEQVEPACVDRAPFRRAREGTSTCLRCSNLRSTRTERNMRLRAPTAAQHPLVVAAVLVVLCSAAAAVCHSTASLPARAVLLPIRVSHRIAMTEWLVPGLMLTT